MRLGVFICCMFCFGFANAETNQRDGLLLRLSLGFGFGEDWQTTDSAPKELRLTGVGSVGDLAIGGIVAKNLAMHATFYSSTLADPVYQPSGIETAGCSESGIAEAISRCFSHCAVSGSDLSALTNASTCGVIMAAD